MLFELLFPFAADCHLLGLLSRPAQLTRPQKRPP